MKFAIRVEEVIGRTIIVEAKDLEEAIDRVEEACNNDDIFLDGIEDFVERNVYPSDSFKNGIVPDGRDVSFYEHLKG
ncbi:MAG: DpnD/PcfM family protein [Bacteroidales bacterium]|nr:DpnD/PcfM family protein [Bacteroidales bacterium]